MCFKEACYLTPTKTHCILLLKTNKGTHSFAFISQNSENANYQSRLFICLLSIHQTCCSALCFQPANKKYITRLIDLAFISELLCYYICNHSHKDTKWLPFSLLALYMFCYLLFYIYILYVYLVILMLFLNAAAQMRDANQNFAVCIQWQKIVLS